MRKTFTAALFLAAATFAPMAGAAEPIKSVPSVDIDRYTGMWHEMARYQSPIQPDNCLNPTMEYGFNDDGNLALVGTCSGENGAVTQTTLGTATVDEADGGARMNVDYGEGNAEDLWIVALADDYSWSIVSDANRDRLWIMTREPISGGPIKTQLVAKAEELGFDTSKLFYSQRGGVNLSSSLEGDGAS